ncbi:unnamed protein product [Cylindrotheca closterium]|uniref:Uncharacterized protein n=1 Tax=Cylindrotheca closterium TaxID=2856 RepID=A0AAD2CIA9_9STRA|nr:unnamed protein product [Cylindrotheca closterium]
MFSNNRKKEALAPPLVSAPPGPQPCLPSLFLGISEWWIANFEDVLRSDLVFSTRAMSLHPLMKGRHDQIHILNYLCGKDLIALSKATNGGSLMVSADDLIRNNRLQTEIHPSPEGRFRGVILTDEWFNVDEEYEALASNLLQAAKGMYDRGCNVVFVTTDGVFSAPARISAIFQLGQDHWRLTNYTSCSMVKTGVGMTILQSAFPSKSVYLKSHLVSSPASETLLIENVNPDDYDSDDSVPTPNTSSPVVVHRGTNGGYVCYFGFVNSLDVSWGAIMLKLLNLNAA